MFYCSFLQPRKQQVVTYPAGWVKHCPRVTDQNWPVRVPSYPEVRTTSELKSDKKGKRTKAGKLMEFEIVLLSWYLLGESGWCSGWSPRLAPMSLGFNSRSSCKVFSNPCSLSQVFSGMSGFLLPSKVCMLSWNLFVSQLILDVCKTVQLLFLLLLLFNEKTPIEFK